MGRIKSKIKLITILVVLSLLVLGFVLLMKPPCLTYPEMTTSANFIERTNPPPQSVISLRCYTQKNLKAMFNSGFDQPDGGVNVKILTSDLVALEIPGPQEKYDTPFEDRVSLYMDERPLIKMYYWESLVAPLSAKPIPLSSEYVIGSYPFLLPGDHIARIIIVTRSGKSFEYEWRFRVTWS